MPKLSDIQLKPKIERTVLKVTRNFNNKHSLKIVSKQPVLTNDTLIQAIQYQGPIEALQ